MNKNAISAGLVAASLFGAATLAGAQVQPPPGAAEEPQQTGTSEIETSPTGTPQTDTPQAGSPTQADTTQASPPMDAGGQAQQQAATPAKNPPTVAPDNPALQKMRMSKIVGSQVNDKEGSKIGDIKDVIVDEKGNASLAIVSSGGVLGAGEKMHAVPWSELQPGQEGSDRVLDMSAEQLDKAPSFESDQWPTLNQQWLQDNRSYYEGR